jgi:hypothetical protein
MESENENKEAVKTGKEEQRAERSATDWTRREHRYGKGTVCKETKKSGKQGTDQAEPGANMER